MSGPDERRDAEVTAGRRPRVTVLSGFSPRATTAATEVLLAADRDLVVVRHDLSALLEGRLHRFVCTADEVLESESIELVHGCVSCSLREDVLPTLVRLARTRPASDQLLVLPEVVEPEHIASACVGCVVDGRPVLDWVRLGTFAAAIDGETFLADLTCDDDLGDRGRKKPPTTTIAPWPALSCVSWSFPMSCWSRRRRLRTYGCRAWSPHWRRGPNCGPYRKPPPSCTARTAIWTCPARPFVASKDSPLPPTARWFSRPGDPSTPAASTPCCPG
ncbi:CobW family GTP-binding protein [Fodinicola feengrottensis]|uniref:GTP-binding protein n=1 Tax=Fodinicola feengrottensis TaxID=435914 RepID=UPI002442EF12|nr:GTP-binding protein [Fodinicola feengrottensis]